MLDQGRGMAQSDVEAARWYRKAADQGHADAQDNMGGMFAQGRGVPQSDVEAAR
jgi:TPR repeat protein